MSSHLPSNAKIVDSHERTKGGTKWSLQEKLLLGLTPKQYLAQAFSNPFNWILGAIFAVGLPLIAGRFFFGLNWVTHSSNDYPWGTGEGASPLVFGLVPVVLLLCLGHPRQPLHGHRRQHHRQENPRLVLNSSSQRQAIPFMEPTSPIP